jgi:hypothetical protein
MPGRFIRVAAAFALACGPIALAGSEPAVPAAPGLSSEILDTSAVDAQPPQLTRPASSREEMDDVPRKKRSADRANFKSDWWLPAPSVFLPGFGQYFQGEWPGLLYTGVAVGGLFMVADGMSELLADDIEEVPDSPAAGTESPAEREVLLGSLAYQGSGFLSAYSAFRSSVPRFQAEDGKYRFLTTNEGVGALTVSPARFDHLAKASAFIPLGLLAGVAGYLVMDERSSHHGADWTFSADDILFSWPMAYNAGVTEEALFRGWLLPVAYQYTGRTWWLANGAQAALFSLAHYGPGNRYPWPQALLGYYFGYLTRKNGWSLSEAIFVHSWWDAILFTAQYATMRRVSTGAAGFRFNLPVPL